MRTSIRTVLLIIVLGLSFYYITQKKEPVMQFESNEYIANQISKQSTIEIKAKLDNLPDSEKNTLFKLVEAARIIDTLFLIQVSGKNMSIAQKLDPGSDAKILFERMFGPWNRLEEDHPFIGNQEKPLGAGYYPEDMTKEEFNLCIERNPDLKDQLENTFTIVRRENKKLKAIPYHLYFNDYVKRIHTLLKEAAEITADASLKKYLNSRADDFLTDDYFQSDMDWMDLSGDLEVVIGPYEVYEDKLFNYKAAYEAFICVVDHEESKKLESINQYLIEMEKNLPIPDQHKNFERGSESPIKVVHEVFSAGDTKAGIQTTAFNLPNDERVREAKGSKKVMLKNIAKAKFEKCWIPIVNEILAEPTLKNVSFDAYFNHILLHEISHGLGPGNITLPDGTETTVSRELKELYSFIEECKADILGIYNLIFLINKGLFSPEFKTTCYATYLGGMFRSIRFGIDEAHGGGVAIQFNYLFEKGAFFLEENGKINVKNELMDQAVKELSQKVLMIEAEGDYQAAQELMEKYSLLTPVLKDLLSQLKNIPIDIYPEFEIDKL